MANTAVVDKKQRLEDAQAFLSTTAWKLLELRSPRKLGDEAPRMSSTWFTKGCPVHCLREIVELLSKESKVTDPVLDQNVLPGDWYHKYAYWQRDGGSTDGRGDNTRTLFRIMGPEADSFAHTTQNGCTTTTSIEYKWDVIEVEVAPEFVQGFDISIGGLGRDPQSNLFTYFISTVEQLTFHDTSVKVREDKFETVYREAWTGLRGTKLTPTDDESAFVTIPVAGSQADGTTLNVQWSHNDRFCTWNAQVTQSVAKKRVTGQESGERTQYTHNDSVTTKANVDKLGHAPEAAEGVTTSHRSVARPDGLFENTIGTAAEQNVLKSRVASRKNAFSIQTTQVDRGQSGVPVSSSVNAGTIVSTSYEKSAGKAFNNTKTTDTERPVTDARITKSASVFGTETSRVDRAQAVRPEDPVAGDGVTESQSSDLTPGELFNVNKTTRVEIQVDEASITKSKNLYGTQASTVSKNNADSIPEAAFSNGVGQGVNASRTPGGRNHVSVATTSESYVPNATISKQATIFEVTQSTQNANGTVSAPSASAGNGVRISSREQRTPYDRKTVTTTVALELAVTEAGLDKTGDIFKTTSRQQDVNVEDPGELADNNPVPGTLLSRGRTKTPGGRRRVSNSTTTFKSVSSARVASAGNFRSSQVSKTDVNQRVVPDIPVGFIGQGLPIQSLSVDMTSAGQKNVTVSTRTPGIFRQHTISSFVMGTSEKTYVVTFMNATQADVGSIAASYPGHHVVPGYGWNEFQLFDGQIKFVPYIGGSSGSQFYEETSKETHYDYVNSKNSSGEDALYLREMISTFTIKKSKGLSEGAGGYEGALNGSSFQALGNDWYTYKKVTTITINHTEVTDFPAQKVLP